MTDYEGDFENLVRCFVMDELFWENSLKRIRKALRIAAAVEKDIADLRRALEYYADPSTYFAISLFPDSPCGDLINDWSVLSDEDQRQWEDYRADKDGKGEYYGKTARNALKAHYLSGTEKTWKKHD